MNLCAAWQPRRGAGILAATFSSSPVHRRRARLWSFCDVSGCL